MGNKLTFHKSCNQDGQEPGPVRIPQARTVFGRPSLLRSLGDFKSCLSRRFGPFNREDNASQKCCRIAIQPGYPVVFHWSCGPSLLQRVFSIMLPKPPEVRPARGASYNIWGCARNPGVGRSTGAHRGDLPETCLSAGFIQQTALPCLPRDGVVSGPALTGRAAEAARWTQTMRQKKHAVETKPGRLERDLRGGACSAVGCIGQGSALIPPFVATQPLLSTNITQGTYLFPLFLPLLIMTLAHSFCPSLLLFAMSPHQQFTHTASKEGQYDYEPSTARTASWESYLQGKRRVVYQRAEEAAITARYIRMWERVGTYQHQERAHSLGTCLYQHQGQAPFLGTCSSVCISTKDRPTVWEHAIEHVSAPRTGPLPGNMQ
ncbi:hypothetical protein Bbelb_433350 [Branchiostoma belcheri]|nr:hypothetical protein Bbelb_433350 [Branchiostoma belcheri]